MSAANPQEPQTRASFPPFFNAGTTLKVDRSFANYNNTDFTYQLLLAGAQILAVSATADPDGVTWHIIVTAAQSAPLNVGAQPAPYTYVERLTDSTTSEVYDVGNGKIMIHPNLAAQTAGSMVTFEEQALAMIESVLVGRITQDVENYSLAGRSITKIPISELMKLRGQYRALVWKQRNPGKLMNSIDVHFPVTTIGPNPYQRPWGTGGVWGQNEG